jgi:Zn-dependent M28 family amino/carboxypeptidase
VRHRFLPLCAAVAVFPLSAVAQSAAPVVKPAPVSLDAVMREIDERNIERTIRTLVGFGTRNTLSAQDDPGRGVGAARDWLYGEFQKIAQGSGGRLKVSLQSFTQPVAPRIPQPTKLTNVLALLEGSTDKPTDRIYIVSGHYDSMCADPTDAKGDAPGANDDASGTAAVLEMARVLSKYTFDAPILFVAVVGEEQGLLGAAHLAEQAKAQNWNVQAMFTNDIIGNTRGGNGTIDRATVRVFSEGVPSSETTAQATVRRSVGGENDSASRQLARYIKEVGEKNVRGMKVMMVYRRDRFGRGGDHIPFNEQGYAAVRFTEPNEDYRHQHQNVHTEDSAAGKVVYGDLPEFVDFAYVAQVARVNAVVLASLASAPLAPQEVTISSRLTYDTVLNWRKSADTNLAGYEIVWRSTTDAVWTKTVRVGNVTTYTAPGVSKDNYFFGVRAVGRNGFRSPVSFPRPVR